MNPSDRFRTVYLPQVRDFLASSLRDVDIIVPVENKGARLFEEASALLPTPLKGQVFLTNAIPYLRDEDLNGKVIGIVDDSTLYGRNLLRVSEMFAKIANRTQLRCFAFAACDAPEIVQKRHANGLRIDTALNLKKPEYDVYISSQAAFLRTRGHSLPIDNTTFSLHYSGNRCTAIWEELLNQLARLGTVTETWSEESEGRLLSATLHFPAGFSAQSYSPVQVEEEGAIKLRLFMYAGSSVITCNPMAFVALGQPDKHLWDAIPPSATSLFRAFREAFRSSKNPLHGQPPVIRNAAYDQLGFYLDCELFSYILGTLHETATMPDSVTHNRGALLRYYGPHMGECLASVLDQFVSNVTETSVELPKISSNGFPQPRQGLAAIATMEEALSTLRHAYDSQVTHEPDPFKWKHRGFSFSQFLDRLHLPRLEGSIYLDVLCDTGHLVPFNLWDSAGKDIADKRLLRCYRAAEHTPEEIGQIFAYVISYLGAESDGVALKTATEKTLLLLKHYLGAPELDPNIKIIRAPLGGVIRVMGPERCADPPLYSLDNYPTSWYRHAEGKDGYAPTGKFLTAITDRSMEKFLSGLNADPYLDRIIAILKEKRGLEMVVLMSMLAGHEFGLTYVTADVEIGLKGLRETSYRGIENVKSLTRGRSELGIARGKLKTLSDTDLLQDLRKRFGGFSVTDRRMKDNLAAFPPLSVQLGLASEAVELADALLEGLTRLEPDPQLTLGETPQPLRSPPNVTQVLADLDKVMRLGEPANAQVTDIMEARLELYQRLASMLYAVSNVRCNFESALPEGTQERYFLVADLTNFTRLGAKLIHSRFRDLTDEAMNIIYNYAELFGAFVAKPSEGDKAMLGFPTRGQAVAAAAFCFEHFRALGTALEGDQFFGIKCGLAAGECSRVVGGDLVGDAINVASRLCSEARTGGTQGAVIATRQMDEDGFSQGEAFPVDITSSKQVVKQVDAIEISALSVCDAVLKGLNELTARIRDGK